MEIDADSPRDATNPADRLRESAPKPLDRRTGWIAAYTDASWHEGDKRGGFGLWIRTDHVRIVRSGPTPDKVRSSLHAEAAAVFAAVHTASALFPRVRGMTVRTDCQAVVVAYCRNACSDPLVREWMARCRKLAREGGVDLRITWVKGHQSRKKSVGAYLNNEVDDLAGKARLDGEHRIRREAVQPSAQRDR